MNLKTVVEELGQKIISADKILGPVKITLPQVDGTLPLTSMLHMLVEPGGMTTTPQQEHGPAVRIMQIFTSLSQTLKQALGTSVAHHNTVHGQV